MQHEQTNARVLFDFWYRAIHRTELRRQLMKITLLETPLVLGRSADGRPFALRDACPHRGMPLSSGTFDGQRIECGYHGWQFDACSGQCQLIPSLASTQTLDVERIHVRSYPCEEQDEYVWVYLPTSGTSRRATSFQPRERPPSLPFYSDRYQTFHLVIDLPVNVDHGIIALMDPAHGPFVHKRWWLGARPAFGMGANDTRADVRDGDTRKDFEPLPLGFRMSARAPLSTRGTLRWWGLCTGAESVGTTIDFVLPNIRLESIVAGKYWFSSLTTVTPTTRDRSRIDLVAAFNFLRFVPGGRAALKGFFGKLFDQDQAVMKKQAEGLRHSPHLMLIDDADRPAKWYFHLKNAYFESRENGRDFAHPMSGPVTLAWRTGQPARH